MKKRFIIVFVSVSIITILAYLQFGRDGTAKNSISNVSGNYYEQNLTVIANKLFIYDKENFSEQILERCLDNSFHDILFSYDITGYPDRICISVYTNPLTYSFGIESIKIQYESTSNHSENVTDAQDKFKILIDTTNH